MAAAMKLSEQTYTFTLLTPAMIGGAKGKSASAEMRIASIRGQIRRWHRQAALNPNCNTVWGCTEATPVASKVSLSLEARKQPNQIDAAILPHKGGANCRKALSQDQEFTLTLRRLVRCTGAEWATAQSAVKLWLLLGGLGLRVNRAAGSVWALDSWVPQSEAELNQTLKDLGYKHLVQLADVSPGNTPQNLRKEASNTVSVAKFFGSISPRRPSPLKMKVIRLGDTHRLLLTGLSTSDMRAARNALGPSKPLGRVAWHSL